MTKVPQQLPASVLWLYAKVPLHDDEATQAERRRGTRCSTNSNELSTSPQITSVPCGLPHLAVDTQRRAPYARLQSTPYEEGSERILMAGGGVGSSGRTVGVLFLSEGRVFFGLRLLYLTAPFHWMPRPRATVSSLRGAAAAGAATTGLRRTTTPMML
eukprot:CAMPEP_0177768228 /NCGR_PEP_ID=MMETSP0491_2-20121128/9600_1 /TAXON_ID=63592 /ORGANISM="Tetraselmis chuii, Strain PLY429" /LENGTH=157 /DNA_ID=CAMNT_0019285003 /DNA_START=70 /DNA_END=543 /DNA_ORIENTATION=+